MTPPVFATLALLALGLCGGAAAVDNADRRLTRALAAEEQRNGPASPYLLPLLEQLAQLRFREGDLGEAAAMRRRALSIAIGAFGSDSASAAEAMTALAAIEIDRGRYLDAEPLLTAAANVLFGRLEPDHPAIVAVLVGRARVASARGDVEPALEWARRAAAAADKNPHSRSTAAQRALGAALTAAARFAEGEALLQEALRRDREKHGSNSTAVARSLSQLANLYLRQQRFADALPLMEEATAIDQALLGATHPFIGDDLFDLGLVYDGLKRPDAARAALAMAIQVLERGAGRETPRVAYAEIELARILRAQGKARAATSAARDARRILRRAEDEERRREREI